MSEHVTQEQEARVSSELLKLTGGASERLLLERLLELFCEALEVSQAALYVEGEGGLQREIRVGRGPFPEHLPDSGEAGLLRVDLPRAKVLHPPSVAGRQAPPLLLLALANAVQVFRLKKQLKQRHFEVAYRGVELEALYDVGLAIASTLNLEELNGEILLRAVSLLDARRGALYLIENGTYRRHRTFGGEARSELEAGDPQVERLLRGEPAAEADVLPGVAHLLAVPIEIDGRPRGLLAVGDKESRRGVGPFADSDRRTLSLLANQAAIALENARLHRQALEKQRLERELELAAQIQRDLLPTAVPAITGFEVRGWSRPARHVGGDYYDLIDLPGGALGAVVADVSGKGMPAALLVSTLHSALRLLLDRFDAGPALLERLNRHILESSAANRFITFLMARVRPDRGEVLYLNAGHNPALLVRRDGAVEQLSVGGLPLGLMPGSQYQAQSATMAPGDLLCLYSDGITECQDPEDREFGARRLADLLQDHRDRPLPEVVAAVDRAATEFAQGKPQGDDQTVVLLRRLV